MDLDNSLLETIRKITNTHFTNPISEDDAISIIEELVNEIEVKEEKIRDMEQDIEENYRPIPVSEQYGISDRDFI